MKNARPFTGKNRTAIVYKKTARNIKKQKNVF